MSHGRTRAGGEGAGRQLGCLLVSTVNATGTFVYASERVGSDTLLPRSSLWSPRLSAPRAPIQGSGRHRFRLVRPGVIVCRAADLRGLSALRPTTR